MTGRWDMYIERNEKEWKDEGVNMINVSSSKGVFCWEVM
jgi:hypothetical protein